MKICLSVVIFVVVLLIGIDQSVGARGGGARGGGSRSGSRSGSRFSSTRSRSSSTSRSSVLYTTRSTYFGPTYRSGSWKTAAAVGTLWGLSSYQRRRLYHSHPDREPTICFNEDDLRNGTYGYFICPEEGQGDDYDSCCGGQDSQYCCPFIQSPGAIVGIVIGVIVACAIIGVVVFCIVRKRQNISKLFKGSSGRTAPRYDQSKTFTSTYAASPVGPPTYSYPQPNGQNEATPPYPATDQQKSTPSYPSQGPPPPIGFSGASNDPTSTADAGNSYAYSAPPYPPNASAPPYSATGFSQPTGPYNTPSVDPPPYPDKN